MKRRVALRPGVREPSRHSNRVLAVPPWQRLEARA